MNQELRNSIASGAVPAELNVMPASHTMLNSAHDSANASGKQMFSGIGNTGSVSTFWKSAHYIRKGATVK